MTSASLLGLILAVLLTTSVSGKVEYACYGGYPSISCDNVDPIHIISIISELTPPSLCPNNVIPGCSYRVTSGVVYDRIMSCVGKSFCNIGAFGPFPYVLDTDCPPYYGNLAVITYNCGGVTDEGTSAGSSASRPMSTLQSSSSTTPAATGNGTEDRLTDTDTISDGTAQTVGAVIGVLVAILIVIAIIVALLFRYRRDTVADAWRRAKASPAWIRSKLKREGSARTPTINTTLRNMATMEANSPGTRRNNGHTNNGYATQPAELNSSEEGVYRDPNDDIYRDPSFNTSTHYPRTSQVAQPRDSALYMDINLHADSKAMPTTATPHQHAMRTLGVNTIGQPIPHTPKLLIHTKPVDYSKAIEMGQSSSSPSLYEDNDIYHQPLDARFSTGAHRQADHGRTGQPGYSDQRKASNEYLSPVSSVIGTLSPEPNRSNQYEAEENDYSDCRDDDDDDDDLVWSETEWSDSSGDNHEDNAGSRKTSRQQVQAVARHGIKEPTNPRASRRKRSREAGDGPRARSRSKDVNQDVRMSEQDRYQQLLEPGERPPSNHPYSSA